MATKSWRTIQELHSKRSPEERAETKRRALADLEMERMRLGQLRRAKALSQQTLAETLEIAQGDVSKIERRSDIYVRTLRRFVEATGGRLRIVAEYPDAEPIEIEGFADAIRVRRRSRSKKKARANKAALRSRLSRTKSAAH